MKTALTVKQFQEICELCGKRGKGVFDYSEDFDMQTSLRNYLEKISGEKINVYDITRICDDCAAKINFPENGLEEE